MRSANGGSAKASGNRDTTLNKVKFPYYDSCKRDSHDATSCMNNSFDGGIGHAVDTCSSRNLEKVMTVEL